MARRYHEIKNLAEYAAKIVVSDEIEWKKFLHTAGYMHKYPFRDQLLIHAQRPDATACAALELWNEKMNCWVNKGAKGIALFDEEGVHRSGLKYVFDVSDVHPGRYSGRLPNLWKMKEEHKDGILVVLEKTYGQTNPNATFENRILELANGIAEEMAPEIVTDQLIAATESSLLAGMDEQNLELRLRDTLSSSIAYMVLERCGVSTENLETMDFSHIHEFNTVESLSVLGEATAEYAGPILRDIYRAIYTYERNAIKEQQRAVQSARDEYIGSIEENAKLGLANAFEHAYNALKRESKDEVPSEERMISGSAEGAGNAEATGTPTKTKTESDGIEKDAERSEYGTSIHSKRGLSDSESDSEQRTEGASDEVRADEEELPETEQKRDLQRIASEGDAERALPDDSGTGRAETGSSDRADGGRAGSERTDETHRSDEMGRNDEQHQSVSRGDHSDGADLQLNEPEVVYEQINLFHMFPSVEEQIGTIIAAEASVKTKAPAAFALKDEDLLDVIRSGGGKENSRKRIYAKYTAGKDADEMTEFLRNEIGITGKGFEFDGQKVSVWFDEEGMRIAPGNSAKMDFATTFSWALVEEFTRKLVEDGTYMARNEAFLVDATERDRVADLIFFFFRDGMDEIPDTLSLKPGDYPESIKHLAELLASHEGRELIAEEIGRAADRIENGETVLKWRYVKKPEYLLSEIADLDTDRIDFPLAEEVKVRSEDFITQDEIDARLTHGSGVSQGLFRIYDYFKEGHDSKDNVAFLKNEYGNGGQSDALIGNDKSWEDHDAKGIKLQKGSIMAPYTSVLLNWKVVEKRIRELIAEDKYLSPKAKEAYEEYRKEKDQKALAEEQERLVDAIEAGEAQEDPEPSEIRETSSYIIYQVSDDSEDRRDVIFENLEHLKDRGLSVDPDNYEKVYTGELEDGTTLDDLYEQFNIHHPADYKGRSMSVSDVVVLHQNGEDKAYFVDSFGFTEVPEFLRDKAQTLTAEPEKEITGENAAETSEDLIAADIQNISYLDVQYSNFGHTAEYELEADIRGERQKLHYEVTRHDGDEEGFSIHTEKEDIYERMSESELRKLEGILADEVRIGRYEKKLEQAESPEEIKNIQYEFMDDENFPKRLTGRFWDSYNAKETQIAETLRANAENFQITDDRLGAGSPKEKFHRNIEAIRTLKQIEDENRTATPEEQQILSQYVGWGGLADAFDETKGSWAEEYARLKGLLTHVEYKAARESTLNAHYTSPTIMYLES